MSTFESVVSVVLLGGAIWALLFQLPGATRDGDRFAIACSVLTALVGLIGWLFIGIGAHSR